MIEILNIKPKSGYEGYELLYGYYDVLAKLPENATNGDMLKAIFPQWNLREEIGFEYKLFGEEHKFEGLVDEDWWNAPYKIKEK